MNGKNLWIKKYRFNRGNSFLYLVADFKRMPKGPHMIVHEITLHYEGLEDTGFDHEAYQYDLEKHTASEVPLYMVADSIFERHRAAYATANADTDGKKAKDKAGGLDLEEVDSGKRTLFDLQFTELFPRLKVEILKEPRSDTFSKILTTMTHLPLKAERRDEAAAKAKKGPRKAAQAGG
ncbi:MAG: hypothetical protein R3224_03780 [Balneolaceae bacterium]|nr:hypothetical protein [Balneolaceae bacterium]